MRSEDTDETILSGGRMNNYNKIKNMTLNEMAEYLTKLTATYCEYCTFKEYCEDNEDNISCREVLKQWLQQESEG